MSLHKYTDFFPEEKCFTSAFFNEIEQYSSKLALVDNNVNISFKNLQNMTYEYERKLHCLLKKGRGKTLVLMLGNSSEFLIIVLAALKLGYTVMTLNPSSTKYEITKYTDGIDINVVLVDDESCSAFLTPLFEIATLKELNNINITCMSHSIAVCGFYDIALIFLSSGTTGTPKRIQISHRSMIAQINQLLSAQAPCEYTFPKVTKYDKVSGVLPYFHLGGMFTVFSMLSLGATIYVNRKWNPSQFFTDLSANEITILNIVPPIMKPLLNMALLNKYPKLRLIFVGASKVDPELVRQLKNFLNPARIIQLFGMTEAGLTLFMSPYECEDPSVVGLPFPGVETKIENEELLIKSPTLMSGYVDGSNDKQIPYNLNNEWFRTGDLVEITDTGFYRIIGRVKDMIKIRGWQVNPAEIEEVATSIANVDDCMVFSKSDNRLYLVYTGRETPENIRKNCEEKFISYKQPYCIRIMEKIPRTESGKLKRGVAQYIWRERDGI